MDVDQHQKRVSMPCQLVVYRRKVSSRPPVCIAGDSHPEFEAADCGFFFFQLLFVRRLERVDGRLPVIGIKRMAAKVFHGLFEGHAFWQPCGVDISPKGDLFAGDEVEFLGEEGARGIAAAEQRFPLDRSQGGDFPILLALDVVYAPNHPEYLAAIIRQADVGSAIPAKTSLHHLTPKITGRVARFFCRGGQRSFDGVPVIRMNPGAVDQMSLTDSSIVFCPVLRAESVVQRVLLRLVIENQRVGDLAEYSVSLVLPNLFLPERDLFRHIIDDRVEDQCAV